MWLTELAGTPKGRLETTLLCAAASRSVSVLAKRGAEAVARILSSAAHHGLIGFLLGACMCTCACGSGSERHRTRPGLPYLSRAMLISNGVDRLSSLRAESLPTRLLLKSIFLYYLYPLYFGTRRSVDTHPFSPVCALWLSLLRDSSVPPQHIVPLFIKLCSVCTANRTKFQI